MRTWLLIMCCVLAAVCGWCIGIWQPAALPVSHESDGVEEGAQDRSGPAPSGLSPSPSRDEVAEAMSDASQDLEKVASDWAEKKPRRFLAWLRGTHPAADRKVTTAFFVAWVVAQPDAAFNAVLDLPPQYGQIYQEFVQGAMLSALIDTDHAAAFRWVEHANDHHLGMKLGQWGDSVSIEMADGVSALPPGDATDVILSSFAWHLAERDFESAKEWAATLSPYQQRWVMPAVLREWAKRDLAAALAFLETDASSSMRQGAGAVVLQAYARKDPKAALTWQDKHFGVPGASEVILRTWMDSDATAVTDHVLSIQDPQQKNAFFETLSTYAARRNAKVAIEWLEPLSSEDRATALNTVAPLLASDGRIEQRRQFLDYLSGLPETEISETLLGKMQPGLVERRPEESLTWAAGLSGENAVPATETVVSGWVKRNPEKAAAAVRALPEGPARAAAQQIIDGINSAR